MLRQHYDALPEVAAKAALGQLDLYRLRSGSGAVRLQRDGPGRAGLPEAVHAGAVERLFGGAAVAGGVKLVCARVAGCGRGDLLLLRKLQRDFQAHQFWEAGRRLERGAADAVGVQHVSGVRVPLF